MKFTSLVWAFLSFGVMVSPAAVTLSDAAFPFEFTVPLAGEGRRFDFKIETVSPTGQTNVSPDSTLRQ
jgi:hypothetical protein